MVVDGPADASGGVPADLDFRERFQRSVPHIGTKIRAGVYAICKDARTTS